MTIFERAKLSDTRDHFVHSRKKLMKYNEEEFKDMSCYVLSDTCVNDLERLESGDYFLDYPQYRLIAKNSNNQKRAVYSFLGNQASITKLLMFSMRSYESIYSDRLFSFRSDKTGKDLLNELHINKKTISECYILKADVTNYVSSIVPDIIISMLEKVMLPQDEKFFDFLKWMLTRNKVIDKDGKVIDHCPGGLGGIPLGNFFMNLYLHEIDDYYAGRAEFYSRYSDDILICSRSPDEIKEFERFFYKTLDSLQLKTNKEKTQIINPGGAFDILGMTIEGERVSISEHSMIKIKRKIRRFTEQARMCFERGRCSREDAAHMLIVRYNQFFFGLLEQGKKLSWARWAFPVITDTESLSEIDHYFQNSLRYVLYGSITKKRRYKINYDKLSSLGYKSLVYYYHHQDKIETVPRI